MSEEHNRETRRLPEAIKPFRVLIIEDEIEVSRLISIALKDRGLHTRCALDGESALNDFAGFQPHLVLLDLTMPGLSGQEVYEAIRSQSDVPVLVVSALVGDRSVPIPQGVSGQLSKPFSPPNLVRHAESILNDFYGDQSTIAKEQHSK